MDLEDFLDKVNNASTYIDQRDDHRTGDLGPPGDCRAEGPPRGGRPGREQAEVAERHRCADRQREHAEIHDDFEPVDRGVRRDTFQEVSERRRPARRQDQGSLAPQRERRDQHHRVDQPESRNRFGRLDFR